VFLAALLSVYAQAETAPQSKAVTFGILPYISPVQMVKFHQPLKVFLQETLNRPVTLVTAPSYEEFIKRTQEGQYDYIMTAPNLGRLAEKRDGYHRVVRSVHEIQGIYLVNKASKIQRLQDLEGKTLTLVKASMIGQMAIRQLKALGLEEGKNITFRYTSTQNNAMYAPLRDEGDASVTGRQLWEDIGDTFRNEVRVIDKTAIVPGFMIMARGNVPEEERNGLRQALLNFPNTDKGAAYCRQTGLKGFALISDREMEMLDSYIQNYLKH
jgi:phosphonate transport system substrate-binding protein